MAWLTLTMPNQTVKNGLNDFFSCTYQPLSFCIIFKKTLRADPELWGCAIFGPKMAHLSWTKFFWYYPLWSLSSTYWLFLLCKILKILMTDPELWGCTIFGPKIVHSPKTNYFGKITNITLIYLLAPFIVQNVKKILPVDLQLWGCAIFGPKMAHFPKLDFFQKTC